MDTAYYIIASAIHTEPSLFSSPHCIIYNKIRINNESDILGLVNIFTMNNFTLSDLRNILYIYITTNGANTQAITRATEYLKLEVDHKNYYSLKQNYDNLVKENKKLQSQNEKLIRTCHNVCKLVADKNTQIENKIVTDLLLTDDTVVEI
jgi:hypothetical protein